jgi:hypothetical protein
MGVADDGRLTAIATILLGLTFVTGFFSQNVRRFSAGRLADYRCTVRIPASS